jgi:hypothetical protein
MVSINIQGWTCGLRNAWEDGTELASGVDKAAGVDGPDIDDLGPEGSANLGYA